MTVFSAGSLAGRFSGSLQCRARNQVYEIRIGSDPTLGDLHPQVGRFRAWDWSAVSWVEALDGFGIPRIGGFGSTAQIPILAGQVATLVASGSNGTRPAEEIVQEFPEISYLTPESLARLVSTLYDVHNIDLTTSKRTGAWRTMGVMS